MVEAETLHRARSFQMSMERAPSSVSQPDGQACIAFAHFDSSAQPVGNGPVLKAGMKADKLRINAVHYAKFRCCM